MSRMKGVIECFEQILQALSSYEQDNNRICLDSKCRDIALHVKRLNGINALLYAMDNYVVRERERAKKLFSLNVRISSIASRMKKGSERNELSNVSQRVIEEYELVLSRANLMVQICDEIVVPLKTSSLKEAMESAEGAADEIDAWDWMDEALEKSCCEADRVVEPVIEEQLKLIEELDQRIGVASLMLHTGTLQEKHEYYDGCGTMMNRVRTLEGTINQEVHKVTLDTVSDEDMDRLQQNSLSISVRIQMLQDTLQRIRRIVYF